MSNFSTLFDLIGVLARRRYQAGEQCFVRLGLNHTEARLLTLLEGAGGEATQEGLSSLVQVDRSNVGRALKDLEIQGYVARSAEVTDRRTRSVRMTDKGRKTAAEIASLRRELAEGFFGALTDEQASVVVDLLRHALVKEGSAASSRSEVMG